MAQVQSFEPVSVLLDKDKRGVSIFYFFAMNHFVYGCMRTESNKMYSSAFIRREGQKFHFFCIRNWLMALKEARLANKLRKLTKTSSELNYFI